nr:expressed protein [Hymenolepis microstoma]
MVSGNRMIFIISISMGLHFPCAWLERDGFFDPRNNFVSKTPFVQSRSQCTGRGHCYMNWLPINSAHAITFKLIGIDDMQDYQFQAHFCDPVYTSQHPHCTKQEGEVAFTMRQIGTWLTLTNVFCRCPQPTEVSSVSYTHGVRPTDLAFRGVFYEMTCAPMQTTILYAGKNREHTPSQKFPIRSMISLVSCDFLIENSFNFG